MSSVLVIGATGLVGRECVRLLLADSAFDRVVVVARRPLEPEVHAPKLDTQIVDFERLDRVGDAFAVDAVICALGTTLKQAGTQDRFRRVDHDYVLEAARLGRAQGAGHFLFVSAIGADSSSRVFYNRVKGEAEDALRRMDYPSLTIVRPSLLLGPRHELRLGEAIAKRFAWLPLGKYKAVSAIAVAFELIRAAKESRPGVRVIESRDIGR